MFRPTLQICCLNAELTAASIRTVRAVLLLANVIQCKQERHHILPMDDHIVLEIHTELVASLVPSLIGKPRACVHSQARCLGLAMPAWWGMGWRGWMPTLHKGRAGVWDCTVFWAAYLTTWIWSCFLKDALSSVTNPGVTTAWVMLQCVAAKSRRVFEKLTLFLAI